MEAIIGIIELTGCGILLFAVSYTFACISGYGEFYDKMLYDNDNDNNDIAIKNNNQEIDDDIIHHLYF